MKACLAIACEENYIRGLKVLLRSLEKNGSVPNVDRILISSDMDSFPGMEIKKVNPADYSGSCKRSRYSKAWYKLEALRLPYDLVVLLDADLLCLGSIADLFRKTDFDLRAAPDHGIQLAPVFKEDFIRINSGVCVFSGKMLGPTAWDRTVEIGRSGHSYDGGDQGAINLFLHENDILLDYLHPKYNALKRLYVSQRKLWSEIEKDIRLLHFVGQKPWDEKTEKGYEKLDSIWRGYEN